MTSTTTRRSGAWRPVARYATALAAAAFAALGVAVAAPAAAAPAASATSAADDAMSPVMIVLDASGSMNQTDAPGPRIEAAKAAVRNLVGGLPANAQVGLTVYGTHTGSSNAEKAAGCEDITQLAPVGTVDKGALTSAVNGIVAKGYTPIGASLQKAAAALPAEGPRAIVLVSDGEDTCSPPPPCDVATQLKAQGVDLVVHTVGFKVDAAARQQLTCIAQATGGTYSDAQDAGSLDTSLDQQVDRALRPYDVSGTPVSGTAGPKDAPALEPGQYQDTLPNGGDDYGRDGPGKYYAVDLQEGETPYLSVTVVPPATLSSESGTPQQLLVTVRLTDGKADNRCEIEEDGQSVTLQRKFETTTVVVAPGAVGGEDWPTNCPTSGTFYLEVSRNFGGAAPLPTELGFRVEPPADVAGLPGPVTDPVSLPLPTASADVTAITAGSSFNSAPELTSGTTYSDSIAFGEDRYYKVHLDWGQQFAFRFDTALIDGLGIVDGVQSRALGANPVRQDLGDIGSQSDAGTPFLGSRAGRLIGSSTSAARWTNRQSSDSDIQPYALDGDYYLILTSGQNVDREATDVPFTLTVDVTGTKEKGPQYAPGTDPSSGTTTSGSTGAAGNGSAGNGAGSNGSSQLADSERTGWSTGQTTVVGGSIGIAVLAAIVLGWLLLGRRRTPRPATPPIMPPAGGSDWS